jgi:hypothetical protein
LFLKKATSPILVTLSGIVTEVNWLPAKAAVPILVTLSGIVTEVNWLVLKAPVPILVTGCLLIVVGIITFLEQLLLYAVIVPSEKVKQLAVVR